jgi:hypothetical protein
MLQSKTCEKCGLEKEDVEIRGFEGHEIKIVDGKIIFGTYAIRYYGAQCNECWSKKEQKEI